MLFSTSEMARGHNLSENGLKFSDRDLERIIQSFLVWIYGYVLNIQVFRERLPERKTALDNSESNLRYDQLV